MTADRLGEGVDVHDRAAWLEWRRQGVGASDVAGILGRSSFASPWSIWATKVGLLPLVAEDPDEPSYVRFGRDVEPVIRKWFTEDTGLYVFGVQTVVRHPGTVYFATLDGLVTDSQGDLDLVDDGGLEPLGIFEAKWTGDPPWEALPDRYWLQAQWAMFCSGLERAWVASIHAPFGRPGPLRIFEVERDAEALDDVVARVAAFWVDHVETGEPPPIDGSPATTQAIKAAYPAEEALTEPVLDVDDARETIADLALLKAQEKELRASLRLLENRLTDRLGEYTEGALDGELAASWRPRSRSSVNLDRLQGDHPEIDLDDYRETTTYRVLLLHGKKPA